MSGLDTKRISKYTKYKSGTGQPLLSGMGKNLSFGCWVWKLWG